MRALQAELQGFQASANTANTQIGTAKSTRDEDAIKAAMANVAGLKRKIRDGEEQQRKLRKELEDRLAELPNIPASEVPDGADETQNVEVAKRHWFAPPEINMPAPVNAASRFRTIFLTIP